MLKNLLAVLSISLFYLAAFGQTTRPAAPSPSEHDSIIAAAKEGLAAWQSDDEKSLRREAVAPMTDEQWKIVHALVAEDAASLRLFHAVVRKLGAEAKEEWPENPDVEIAEFLKYVDRGDVVIDADSATILLPADDEHRFKWKSLSLSRQGGSWKLNIYEFLTRGAPKLPPGELEEIGKRVEAYQRVIARVQKGEFADEQAVERGMADEGLIAISNYTPHHPSGPATRP